MSSASRTDIPELSSWKIQARLTLMVLLGVATTLLGDELLQQFWSGSENTGHLFLVAMLGGGFTLLGHHALIRPGLHLIRAHEQMEHALIDSEVFLRGTLDALTSHIAIIDEQGQILAVNQSWRNFAKENGPIQSPVNEGANYFLVCEKADGEEALMAHRFVEGIRQVLCGECQEFSMEYPCHSEDQQRWFIGRVTLLQNSKVPQAVVSHSCITERKLAEEALQRSEDRYRVIFETTGNAKLVIDEEGLIVQTNSRFAQVSGFPVHEVEGQKNWREFIDPVDLPIMNRLNQDLWSRTSVTPLNAEIRFRNRAGQERYALMCANVLSNTSHAIVSLTDFTSRRLIQAAVTDKQGRLIREHQDLRQAFREVEAIKKEWECTLDSLEDIVILTDGEGRIRRCNKALHLLSGKDFQQIRNTELADLLSEFEISLDDQGGHHVVLNHPAHGRRFILKTYPIPPTMEEAGNMGAVLTLQDVTQLTRITQKLEENNKQLEEKSRQLQHAYDQLKTSQLRILQQEKMASIGQLAAGVAHEINNPIGYISSNLGTMRKYLDRLGEYQKQLEDVAADRTETLAPLRRKLKVDFIAEDLESLIAESREGAERVAKIVRDLKSFSRSDEEEEKFADLITCLESTVNIVWNEIKYKATLQRDFVEMPRVLCHPQQLNQVFMNLLVNAAQAIERKGKIYLSTTFDEGGFYIKIADSGSGIAPEHLDHLFEPFFTTKDVGQGTGLGLSIVHEIVAKHGGEISVDSALGEGTEFTVRIPRERGEDRVAASASEDPEKRSAEELRA